MTRAHPPLSFLPRFAAASVLTFSLGSTTALAAPDGGAAAAPAAPAPDVPAAALPEKETPLPPPDAHPEVTAHESATAALGAILARAAKDGGGEARVVAFGEYHQTKKDDKQAGPASALKRFTGDLLGVVAGKSSDLVLETWVTEGSCGKQEKAVVTDVQKTTERPQATENELVTLARRAKESGLNPHILKLSCKDYESLHGADGSVDYEKLLKLVNELLERKIAGVLRKRGEEGVQKTVLVYGGALHNDLFPMAELAPYTFGQKAQRALAGRYLEVDLYVPEFIERDARLVKEPWYASYKKAAQRGAAQKSTFVVRRGPGSYILLFPRTVGAAPAPAPAPAPANRPAAKSGS